MGTDSWAGVLAQRTIAWALLAKGFIHVLEVRVMRNAAPTIVPTPKILSCMVAQPRSSRTPGWVYGGASRRFLGADGTLCCMCAVGRRL